MQKLDYLRQKKLNPGDELRDLLISLENGQTQINLLDQTGALNLLYNLDKADALFDQLESAHLDLTPEQTRFSIVQAHYRKNVTKILKALGGSKALSRYRPSPPPDRKRWWWYMHELVAAQKQRLLRRVVIGVLIFLVALGGIYLAFNTFLAPSPEAIARVEAERNSLEALSTGDYEGALAAVDKGLAVVPTDPSLLLIKGIVYEASGTEEKSAQAFEMAKANLTDLATYHLGKGQLYFQTNQFERAEAEARQALEHNEDLAAAWLLLGQSLESQGQRVESIPAYQQAGDVALATGENEIVVLARLALSRVGIGR